MLIWGTGILTSHFSLLLASLESSTFWLSSFHAVESRKTIMAKVVDIFQNASDPAIVPSQAHQVAFLTYSQVLLGIHCSFMDTSNFDCVVCVHNNFKNVIIHGMDWGLIWSVVFSEWELSDILSVVARGWSDLSCREYTTDCISPRFCV